jgi:DNA helicase HerA-like ATPase
VQSFIHGVDFPTILSEARKYHLTLVVATQTLTQLPPACLAAVFGNCATVVSFRIGGEDAKAIREEFSQLLGMAGAAESGASCTIRLRRE